MAGDTEDWSAVSGGVGAATVKSIASDFWTGMILSGANEYVSTPKVENEIKRPTWRQSLYKERHSIDIKIIIFLHQVGEAA